MSVANGDHVRLSVIWRSTISGDQVNVIDAEVSGLAGPMTDTAFLAAIDTALVDWYETSGVCVYMPDSTLHYNVHAYNVTSGLVIGETGAISTLDGQSALEPLPSGATGLVLLRTGVSRVVGRKYLPSFVGGTLTNGVWSVTIMGVLTAFAAAFSQLTPGGGDLELTPFVFSQVGNVRHPIVNAQPVRVPAYQRRRREGRGS